MGNHIQYELEISDGIQLKENVCQAATKTTVAVVSHLVIWSSFFLDSGPWSHLGSANTSAVDGLAESLHKPDETRYIHMDGYIDPYICMYIYMWMDIHIYIYITSSKWIYNLVFDEYGNGKGSSFHGENG